MRYMAAFVILASLVLPAKSATANVLSPADYENFHNLDLKMLTIGDDLYALITNRPAAQAPDCLMQLAFKFDAVQADLPAVVAPASRFANSSATGARRSRASPVCPDCAIAVPCSSPRVAPTSLPCAVQCGS
jgi:hypothetical protein